MDRYLTKLAALTAILLAGALPAHAAVSPKDGYTEDGGYRVNVELTLYGWLPAESGNVKLGNGASASIGAGMPTASQLENNLTGAFMGDARLRYGPWSAEVNIDYVGVTANKNLPPDVLGIARAVNMTTNLTRVAPGVGYQVFNGDLGALPTTVDARAGFAWFQTNATLDLDRFLPSGRTRTASVSDTISFVQPWLGARVDFYPSPRWRLELSAQGQGFGMDGGSWGWGATASATWAATSWLNLLGGFAALNNTGYADNSRMIHSVSITSYGPFVGLSFTF